MNVCKENVKLFLLMNKNLSDIAALCHLPKDSTKDEIEDVIINAASIINTVHRLIHSPNFIGFNSEGCKHISFRHNKEIGLCGVIGEFILPSEYDYEDVLSYRCLAYCWLKQLCEIVYNDHLFPINGNHDNYVEHFQGGTLYTGEQLEARCTLMTELLFLVQRLFDKHNLPFNKVKDYNVSCK